MIDVPIRSPATANLLTPTEIQINIHLIYNLCCSPGHLCRKSLVKCDSKSGQVKLQCWLCGGVYLHVHSYINSDMREMREGRLGADRFYNLPT